MPPMSWGGMERVSENGCRKHEERSAVAQEPKSVLKRRAGR